MKNIDMEPLFESTYVLIDIVPSQVPESRAEEYLALEQEYTATAKRDALYEKFAAILTAVNNRFATVLLSFPEDSQTDSPSDEAITGAVQAHCRRGAVQLFLPDENALITLDGGDLNMTVYQPSADLLSFLQVHQSCLRVLFRSQLMLSAHHLYIQYLKQYIPYVRTDSALYPSRCNHI